MQGRLHAIRARVERLATDVKASACGQRHTRHLVSTIRAGEALAPWPAADAAALVCLWGTAELRPRDRRTASLNRRYRCDEICKESGPGSSAWPLTCGSVPVTGRTYSTRSVTGTWGNQSRSGRPLAIPSSASAARSCVTTISSTSAFRRQCGRRRVTLTMRSTGER